MGRPAGEERYSFHFDGRLQTLDHMLVTDGLRSRVDDFRYAHFDNDYFERRTARRTDTTRPTTIRRSATLDLPAAPVQRVRPLIVGDASVNRWVLGFPGIWSAEERRCAVLVPLAALRDDGARLLRRDPGASGLLYRVQRADRGSYLRFQVTATGRGGATVAVSPPERVR